MTETLPPSASAASRGRHRGILPPDGVDPDSESLPRRKPGRHLDRRIPAGTHRPVDPEVLRRVLAALEAPTR